MLCKGSPQTEGERYWSTLPEDRRLIDGYQEYSDWKHSRNMHQPPHHWDHSHFSWFTSTDGLLEKVISLPFEVQSALLERKIGWVEGHTVLALLDLLEETQSDYLKATKWKPYLRTSVPTDPDAPKISPEFESEFERFLKFQKNFDGTGPATKRALDATFVLLLVKKHGEETVREVMRAWRQNHVTNNVSDLKLIVEQWDGLKHTSIDWAMALLGIEKEKTYGRTV